MSGLHQPELAFDEPVRLLPQDGRARMIFAWRDKAGRLNRQYAAEIDDVSTIRHLLRAVPDVYEAQWWMDRPVRRYAFALAGTHAFTDLDTYRIPALDGSSHHVIAGALLRYCDETGLPRPSAITCSGRGLQPKWCFAKVVGREHVGKMVHLNRELMRRLSLFGADPRATDVSRLLRVTGTLHSGAGRLVEVLHLEECNGRTIAYDPHWLCEQLAPGADQIEEQVPIPAPASDGAREAPREFQSAPYRFTRESWFWAITEDIRKLAMLRWGGVVPKGWRDTFAFLVACQMLRIFPPAEASAETRAIVSTIIEVDFLRRHLEPLCSTAMRRAREAWSGRDGWAHTYRYGKSKLIEVLQITQGEMRDMRALISEGEYLRRHCEHERARRAAAGAIERQAWLAENNRMRERPWQAAGISRATWYRRRART